MATDLDTRKSSSKSEAYLQRKLAELCARIERVDLVAHLLAVVVVGAAYLLAIGIFDWFAGNSITPNVVAFRWTAWLAFLGLTAFLLFRTSLCLFRRVNPYYVAHQLEATAPNAKNGLINWLDLHDDELPSAFQKNLSARAADQWQEGDADQIVKKRKNWVLLGALSVPIIGLMILLVLGPAAFLVSMTRAFAPWYVPPTPILRTQLTLVHPDPGNLEVNPTQSVTFAAKIHGRVPTGNRPDAPKLHWRYQDNEDFFTQPLQRDDAGLWTATLPPTQLRTGLTYKLTAGDAETPEYQVSVRARAHVKKFEITYHHRPYRKLKDATEVFPNPNAARPHIAAPRGSAVEMLVRTSRPMKDAQVEFIAKNVKKSLPLEMRKADPHTFGCRWTLEEPGQFRVFYTSNDGEENADRELYDIDVLTDELPKVLLTRPAEKKIELPSNGTLLLQGSASSAFGIRGMTLQMRVLGDKNAPQPLPLVYRPGKSFKLDDGSYPLALEYMDFVALDKIKNDKGATHASQPGAIIEFWLEATDDADYPNPTGNIGRTDKYQVKLLLPQPMSDILNKTLGGEMKKHAQKQDQRLAQQNQERKDDKENKGKKDGAGNGGGTQNAGKEASEKKKENQDINNKLDKASQSNPGQGPDPKPGEAKQKPDNSPDAPQPKGKGDESKSNGDKGNNKEPGDAKGDAGEPKGDGAKDKQTDKGPPQGNAKGQEQNGPQAPNKDQQTAKDNPKEPSFDRMEKNLERLQGKGPDADAAAKDFADIAKNADDPRKREFAKEVLAKNGRDQKTGKKMLNPFNSGGKSPGISDEIKTAAANREFSARLGQMQLDDWKKRVTPDLLKKAGLSEDDWQRYIENTRSYDALVRQLNAEIAMKALKEIKGPRVPTGSGLTIVENTGTTYETGSGAAPPPPELRDALNRLKKRQDQ